MKRIRLSFDVEKTSSVAILLEDRAPQTSAYIWELLQHPLELEAVHAMFTGRELSVNIPYEGCENGLVLPRENQTMFPLPGDLIWNAYAAYEWQGIPHPVYDFGIFYGRESRILLPAGWRPSNCFGTITENLEAFASVCAKCQREGVKRIRLERVSE
jgi:hypothetical protein